nr:GTPase domain-containing protein [Actinomycetota bacterium]
MAADVTEPLARLRDDLRSVRLELEVPGAAEARRARDDLVAQVDDYLLPRLRQMEAPVLMVVGGSTGAGKSTLVNSLIGTVVSPAGVLRPTTRLPVLACHPDDLRWFEDDRILPGLARTTGGSPAGSVERGSIQLVPTPALTPGLALLDSPDIDSVLSENRALANQLLAAADAWLFVTTAARYADAVPWEFLHAARERGTTLSIVLNRVPDDAGREVPAHLQQMLRERDLGDSEVLVVPEVVLETELLPQAALAPVRAWLDDLAADAQARAALVRRTLR